MDRLTPTRRPPGLSVMHQKWRDLLFLHWELPADAIRPTLPAGLELDTFAGRAFVGLVGFTMKGIRPAFVPPLPWLSSSHETNLRTYVHRDGVPGVWFYSLDASRLAAVLGARATYRLPYYWARMRLHRGGGRYRYVSSRRWPGPRGAGHDLTGAPRGAAAPAPPGTLEHFLVERYVLFTRGPRGLRRAQVHHAPYPLQPAEASVARESLLAAAGLDRPAAAPLAHFATGVEVEVFAPA
jgi:uncharacterized protein YqjF (DUF2071 family)